MSEGPGLKELIDQVLENPMRALRVSRSGVPAAMVVSVELWNMIRGTGVISWEPEERE